jgi:hypothetical protein
MQMQLAAFDAHQGVRRWRMHHHSFDRFSGRLSNVLQVNYREPCRRCTSCAHEWGSSSGGLGRLLA